MIKELNYVTKL